MHAEAESEPLRSRAALALGGEGNVATGLPALDHLLALLAQHASFELELEVAPGSPNAEAVAAGRALGDAIAPQLRAGGVRGHGSAVLPADEALAHVALEVSERPGLFSNVDLTSARLGGAGTDLVARFLESLAGAAGLTLHVRLIEGDETQHVLDAIFKALGAALAEACAPRPPGRGAA